ncbi:hypothetical protein [Streptomyces sp. NRRL F-2664]|uniref:hypothetical protein n=1 Tax=Streptomyces sp. NRRL F-2664 TaxID=1463842 RepID=UPI00068EDD3F|nr:hypothetical protein [Streptomyces sp. NRRL F-2664]
MTFELVMRPYRVLELGDEVADVLGRAWRFDGRWGWAAFEGGWPARALRGHLSCSPGRYAMLCRGHQSSGRDHRQRFSRGDGSGLHEDFDRLEVLAGRGLA